MDVDNENFYDEIAPFMSQPGYYSLEDLDEIIRSTDSHLDASIDINAYANTFDQNDFEMAINNSNISAANEDNFQQIKPSQQQCFVEQETEINSKKDYPSNFLEFTSSQQSATYLSPYETPARTSSPISMSDGYFNPDDFINFLNDDNIKTDDLTSDTIMKLNENCRNTPSPTGSCTSSSGSSTSGIQSDASSLDSMTQNIIRGEVDDDLLEFVTFKRAKSEQGINTNNTVQKEPENFVNGPLVVTEEDVLLSPSTPTSLPITVPVLPVSGIPSVQPVNVVRGSIIPVQTVPLTEVNPVENIKAPTAIKLENKPSTKVVMGQRAKLVTASTNSADDSSLKITPPPNAKPKTIFLSSNDFKALMQKINSNGKKIAGANGQIPKIIMKTANGKVIAANKITNNHSNNTTSSTMSTNSSNNNLLISAGSSKSHSSQLAKSSVPLMVNQQPNKFVTSNACSSAIKATTATTLTHTKRCRTDFASLRGVDDDKLIKKQLRMLKNRESASLSRRKKKEYVEQLENRISNLEKENYSLKGENSSLRSQLMAVAQTCNCKHGSVREFILNTLNMDVKDSEASLKALNTSYLLNNTKHLDSCSIADNNNITGTTTSTKHHVKIAPKPANSGPFINKGFKHRMNAATVKKNVAVLFAMAFMITLNVGNFQNYLNKSALEQAIETSVTGVNEEPVAQTGRRLLWVPNEQEFHEQTNRSKREIEMVNMPPPPLHFLRPSNRTTADKIKKIRTTENYANSTHENMRLARNLHKWIGGNDFLNLTGNGIGNDFKEMEHFKFGPGSYMDYELPLQAPIGAKQKRKIILESQTQEKNNGRNSLDFFKPRISEEYMKLFRGIKRQDDTFYVLSFNMDHILLPASIYNKSSRPKMSLMLPAGDPSNNGDIVLMQIDCEVINTTELEIKSHIIPEKLRPSKHSGNVPVNQNEVSSNEKEGAASVAATELKDFSLNRDESKNKPSAPRTYFMIGPKNQSFSQPVKSIAREANIAKRKPNIVKLNANNSVIGSGVLNVRNSSLYSRMRETIGSQTINYAAAGDIKRLI